MSAIHPSADIAERDRHVRFVPNGDIKVRTSLCLSWHPPNPPTLEEVIQKARSKRQTFSPSERNSTDVLVSAK